MWANQRAAALLARFHRGSSRFSAVLLHHLPGLRQDRASALYGSINMTGVLQHRAPVRLHLLVAYRSDTTHIGHDGLHQRPDAERRPECRSAVGSA